MTAGVTKKFTIQQRNSENTDWDTLHPESEISQIVGLQDALDNINTTLDGKANSSNFSNNLYINGFQNLQGGLIIQWGFQSGVGNDGFNIVFPVAFNEVYSFVATVVSNDAGGTTSTVWCTDLSTLSAYCRCTDSRTIRWIAIGH
ncbi:hypothetical protein NOM01_10960 [Sporolactobacillus sp. STSJ-5]|uniref:gp53-like domain-containing protein n=1 Tax=Sporolactobacillus sp. STSJ-5 TaxID=2965076 RepID=UPI002106E1D5|nr:hypothetical protein [Sporolactobacillus sp. STSJ-5]MCQ2010535.1 hypothetical protein [Sporolactobacillus sp. STSJ-5]